MINRFGDKPAKSSGFQLSNKLQLTFLASAVAEMESKRQRVSDLLDAQVPILEIAAIVECSRQFGYRIKKMKEAGESLARRSGSGGLNKIINEDFLVGLSSEIEADPTRSMRKLAKDLGVSEFTIRNAVGQLGLHSYVRRRRQLLSTTSKNSRVERGKKLINWLKKKPSFSSRTRRIGRLTRAAMPEMTVFWPTLSTKCRPSTRPSTRRRP